MNFNKRVLKRCNANSEVLPDDHDLIIDPLDVNAADLQRKMTDYKQYEYEAPFRVSPTKKGMKAYNLRLIH